MHLDFEAEVAPSGQRSPARPNPALAHRLGMLPGLGSQRPTPLSNALVHARDVQLDLGNRLGQLGDQLLQRMALRMRLLDAQEQIRPAGVRVGMVGIGLPANA